MNELNIHLLTSAEGLVLVADVDGERAAAISFADGRPVGDPERADGTVLSVLRFYRWGLRGITAVWVA